jgi:hypothetical protein
MSAGSPSEWPSFLLFAALPFLAGLLLWRFARAVRAGRFQRTWLRLVAGNLLVLLFLGAVLFLAGETWFRFFRDTTDAFNSSLTSRRWFARHFHVNNLRVRDNVDYELRRMPGRPRISIIGDSFAAGHGVTDVERRFGNLLRSALPESEVHVLGHPGFDTGQETALIRLLASIGYEFDTVVLVYCLNDIGDLLPEWRRTLERLDAESKPSGWLAGNSYFVNTLSHRWRSRRDPAIRGYFDGMKQAYQGAAWTEQQVELARLHEAVAAQGARLVVVTFPFMHVLGPDYEWKFAHEQLDAFWRAQKVPHLDLLPVFAGHRPAGMTVNRWDAHPSERAHALAADAMLKFLQEPPWPAGRAQSVSP